MSKKFKAPTHESITAHWEGLFEAVFHAEDLVCVVVSASYVDYALSAMLKAHFIESNQVDELFNPGTGALGTFMTKANLSYCLGMLSEQQRNNLALIAKVRNQFSHKIDGVSFKTQEIQGLCGRINYGPLESQLPPLEDVALHAVDDGRNASRAKTRFKITALGLCVDIQSQAICARRCVPKAGANTDSTTIDTEESSSSETQDE